MTAYTNTRDNNVLPGVGFKDGDTLTTVNGSKWIWQNESWFPVMFAGNPDVQPLTVQRNSSGGVGKLRRGASAAIGQGRGYIGADRLNDLLSWLIPTNVPVLDPNRFYGMTPLTSGVMTISHNPASGEFPGSSLKIDMSGAGLAARYPNIPTTIDVGTAGNPVVSSEVGVRDQPTRAGGHIYMRIKVSDWSKVLSLTVDFLQGGGSTNKRRWAVVVKATSGGTRGVTQFGATDPFYASAWNDKWRTVMADSTEMGAAGSPAPWGYDAKYFEVTGFGFTVETSGPVTIEIARIYSPEWPCAIITPIFDGWYKSVREYVQQNYLLRGWGCGGSANMVDGLGENPAYADLKLMSDLGFDVFEHGHKINGSGAPSGMTYDVVGNTSADLLIGEAAYRQVLAAQRRAILAAGVNLRGMRWHQWLQNDGKYDGKDMAKILKSFGVNAGRGNTTDAEWGVDPFDSFYVSRGSVQHQTHCPRRGRFNRRHVSAYENMAAAADYADAGNAGAAPTLRQRLDFAAMIGGTVCFYHHKIKPKAQILSEVAGGALLTDVTPEFMADQDAHLLSIEKAGSGVIANPTDMEMLTFWRPGDVYMRWDGEWVYREDPTRIAF